MLLGSKEKLYQKNWFLEGILSNGEKITVCIDRYPFVIGRSDECNLHLLKKTVSRHHAEIYNKTDGLFIRDLQSKNGTCINDKIIKSESKLNNGDHVVFGDIKFKVFFKDFQEKASDSGTYFMTMPARQDNFSSHYNLTRREEEILFLAFQGKSTKEIAKILYVSTGTAKNHLLNIFKKTNTHSKFELLTLYNNYNSITKTSM
jgi:DNA-binding CsgD family transcriptional regulator